MTKAAHVLLMAAICLLAGCADSIKIPKDFVIKQATPQELVFTYIQACEKSDYPVMLACHYPDERDYFGKYYALEKRYRQSTADLADAIENKIGKDAAARFRKTYHSPPVCRFCPDWNDYNIDPADVRFTKHGDFYWAYVKDEFCGYLIQVDDLWYIYTDDIKQDRKNWDLCRNMTEEFIRLQKKLIGEINRGKFTEEDFRKIYTDCYPEDKK